MKVTKGLGAMTPEQRAAAAETRRQNAAARKAAGVPSLRTAVNEMCRQCVHDPESGLGTWRQQTEACRIEACPLWLVRPKSSGGSVYAEHLVEANR